MRSAMKAMLSSPTGRSPPLQLRPCTADAYMYTSMVCVKMSAPRVPGAKLPCGRHTYSSPFVASHMFFS